ncbi:MAG TPA: ABC transporter permease subunit, partial [Phycisphaerae bacterium]|nr:ABC transporter permease subunit [Phycisphaerae bacterium]
MSRQKITPRADDTQQEAPVHQYAVPKGLPSDRRRHRFSWSVWLAGVLTAFFCLILAWPFIFGAGWQDLLHPTISSDDWRAVAVSILCASADAALMIILATPLAWILARRRFRGRLFLQGLALVPLLTPPLAMGMLLANVLGPESAIGKIARYFDITLTNSIPALIIAGFYAAAPFYVFGAKLAFEAVPPGYEEMARLLGKSRMTV